MTSFLDTGCCAVIEIKNLSDSGSAEEAFKHLMRYVFNEKVSYIHKPFCTFTAAVKCEWMEEKRPKVVVGHPNQVRFDGEYGADFAAFIQENNLGTTITTAPAKNFTGNYVQVWVWSMNWEGIRTLYTKLCPPAPEIEEIAIDTTDDVEPEFDEDFDEDFDE